MTLGPELRPPLPVRIARGAAARLRRPDLARGAEDARQNGYQPGDEIGQTGIESALRLYLRGVPGSARVRVDSLGRPRSRRLLTTAAAAGADGAPDDRHAAADAAQNALAVRDPARAQQRPVGGRRRRDRGAEPEGRLDPRDGVLADVRPVGLQRTRDASASWPRRASRRRPRSTQNYPALNRALDGTYPPGSVFKPLTAIAALQEHLIKPYAFYPVHRHVRRSRGHCAPRLPQLGPLRQPGDGPADGDRVLVRHVLLPPRQQVLSAAEGPRPADPAVGARASGSGGRAAPTSARRRPGSCRRSAGSTACTRGRPIRRTGRSTGSGSRATRSSSRSARATCTVTPLQMARFYAAIANGGKLVTPHILMDVENPNGTIVPTAAPPAPRPIPGLDPANLKIVQQGLFEATHDSLRHVVRRVRQLPGADRRQDRDGAEGRPPPGLHGLRGPVVVVRLRSGGRREDRRLRRDRERRRRRRGGGAGRRAGLREVLQRSSRLRCLRRTYIHSD